MEIEFQIGSRAAKSIAELARGKRPAVLLVAGEQPKLHRRGWTETSTRSAFRATGDRLAPILRASLQEGLRFAALDMPRFVVPQQPDQADVDAAISHLKQQAVDVVTVRYEPDVPANQRLLGQLVPQILRAGIDVVLAGPPRTVDKSHLIRLPELSYQVSVRRDITPDTVLSGSVGELTAQLKRALLDRLPGERLLPDLGRIASTRPTRFVNTLIGRPDSTVSVPADRPLDRDTAYEVRLNIGHPDPASVLPASDGVWPQEQLPEQELRLTVVFRMDGWQEPALARLTLPASESSFACSCPDGGQHHESCERDPWLRFALHTPDRHRRWRGGLDIYYRAALVHAQRLVLPVGDRQGGPRAEVTYRLTTSFANLGELAERTASILVSDRGSRVTVNGLSFASAPLSLAVGAVDDAAYAARHELYDIHLSVDRRGTERSRYRAGHDKDQADFEADLRRLARLGADLFSGLSSEDPAGWRLLPELIRHEATSRGAPPTLLVAESTDLPTGRHLPWALVYDLPVGSDPAAYRLCESVRRFGPAGAHSDEPVPATCPVGDHLADGEEDLLCPYGFWGLSCLLEQPLSASADARSVVTEDSLPVSMVAAVGSGLDQRITRAHLRQLRDHLGEAVIQPEIESPAGLAEALAGAGLDVAYLYAHCGNQRVGRAAASTLYMRYGDDPVGPLEIHKWSRRRGDRRLSWDERRRPLVVLNGCHTVERSSATLVDLAGSFVRFANAAGVLGTEVAMEQGLASYVAERLLELVVGQHQPVGRALHQIRWQLLAKGNVMGLAYTPYCLSTLTVRPHGSQNEEA